MAEISRTGISLEQDLLAGFDKLIARRGYQNRSEALRDLIREALLSEVIDSNKPVVGTLTLAPVAWQIEASLEYGKVESKQRFPLFHAPNCGGELTNSPRYTNNLAGTNCRAGHYRLELVDKFYRDIDGPTVICHSKGWEYRLVHRMKSHPEPRCQSRRLSLRNSPSQEAYGVRALC